MAQAKVDRVLLVGGATRMPKIRQMMSDYFGFPPDTAVDSDEAVMHGAAIEAARLTASVGSADLGGVRLRTCSPWCREGVKKQFGFGHTCAVWVSPGPGNGEYTSAGQYKQLQRLLSLNGSFAAYRSGRQPSQM